MLLNMQSYTICSNAVKTLTAEKPEPHPSSPISPPHQVDGPPHFIQLASGGRWPNGAMRPKRRLLGRVGWGVVSVPYWEWGALAGPAEQAPYLRRRLPALPCARAGCHRESATARVDSLLNTRRGP
jgi:hypothetical protein